MPEHNTSPLFLAGEWADGSEGSVLEVENPADESVAGRVAEASLTDLERAVAGARRAQPAWAARTVAERAAVLVRLAELIEADTERLAAILVAEAGKPIAEARGEVAGAAGFCRFFAGIAPVQGGEILPSARRNAEIWIRREPVGVVGGIIPWNFPLALTARKLAPALVSGNALVLKPAELTPLSALAVADLAERAGVPAGVLSVLPGPGATLGAALVRMPGVDFVTMTGSVRAGRSILRDAAERIIPVSLELGGKAPFIVFDDADINAAVEAAVTTRMMNNGQACVCNERTYVQRGSFDRFVAAYAARLDSLQLGDPRAESTQVGPKISRRELENVERIVAEAVDAGATVVTGGERPSGGAFDLGHWYRPTLLVDVADDAAVMREEIFGPVTPIVPFDREEDAVRLANDTEYGLSSYIYTEDLSRAMRMTRAVRSGEIFINRPGPEEPSGFHGGWGSSGLGGDDGTHGLELYSRKQTVYVSWQDRAGR
ncbi:aldehyde dehydrogenase family protein [Microbacterium lushaniae]|nr:aldehyde dehydrogenase family protein [Microbacterium lushaniae]KAA9155231.1 aldehyde dehydrogenase family protein [Microbacterium lushaniae]